MVYVANKDTLPGYQVRIDLRSIGIDYYSKMHRSKSIYKSLENALIDLFAQLKKIPTVKKSGRLIERAKSKNRKNISLNDNRALRTVVSKWDSNHRLELSFSAPNNVAGCRFSASLGGRTTLSYRRYQNAVNTMSRLSLLHTSFSANQRYSTGAEAYFNELDLNTQKAIVDACSEELEIPVSDIAHHCLIINPAVRVGYLPSSSLRQDSPAVFDSELPMQVVSLSKKDGYVAGPVRKHDLLYNAECVAIDSILKSNLVEYHFASINPPFQLGEHQMALLLSRFALECIVKQKPNLDVKSRNIDIMSPAEFFELVQGTETPALKDIGIEVEKDEDFIIAFKDGFRTQSAVALSEWAYDIDTAVRQLCIVSETLNKAKRLTSTSKSKDYSSRYAALGLNFDEIDLSRIRFLSSRGSKTCIQNLTIRDSGMIYYQQKNKASRVSDSQSFDAPENYKAFESIIIDLFGDDKGFNSQENLLLKHIYSKFYEQV